MFKNVKPKWYIGISALAVTIVFFIFGAVPLQQHFGMWGLAITELGILLIALAPIFLFKWKISDVMPVKKIRPKQLLAVALLFVATYFTAFLINIVTAYIFPEMNQMSSELAELYQTVPFALSLIIISITPGICEEVLHRGLIQHTLKNIKSDTAVIILMSVIFGVFHLSPYRFLPSAVIGFVLSYIMLKTGNFLLPVLYHTAHNALSVTLSIPAQAYYILPFLSPLLYYLGAKLLNEEKPKKKTKYIAIAVTLILPILGMGIFFFSPPRAPVTEFSFTADVNNETPPIIYNATIEKEGGYDLHVSMSDKTVTVITTVKVEHEDGEIVWDIGGGDLFASKPTNLRAGEYKIIFTFDTQSEQFVPVEISFAIK